MRVVVNWRRETRIVRRQLAWVMCKRAINRAFHSSPAVVPSTWTSSLLIVEFFPSHLADVAPDKIAVRPVKAGRERTAQSIIPYFRRASDAGRKGDIGGKSVIAKRIGRKIVACYVDPQHRSPQVIGILARSGRVRITIVVLAIAARDPKRVGITRLKTQVATLMVEARLIKAH